LHFRQGLESLAIDKTKMDFVCLSSAGYEKITLSVHNISFFLTKTMMDEQLCELLKTALQNPKGSSESDRAAEALALIIDQLPEPKRYLEKNYLPYYGEALERYTQPDVKKNIHKFPGKYGLNIEDINCQNYDDNRLIRKKFINWVMTVLKSDCIDIYRKYNPKKNKKDNEGENLLTSPKPQENRQPISTDQSSAKDTKEKNASTVENKITDRDIWGNEKLSGIKKLLQDELQYFAQKLKKYIETDPENRLKNCHVENQQKCNCQILVQLRFLKESSLTLREIHEQLEIPLTTISSHLKRKCIPLLQKIAKELGYE
jgi:hypothetical protein